MPKKFLLRISPRRQHIMSRRWLRPVHWLLDHRSLWAARLPTVAPAFATGLFCAWLPIPGHSLVAAAIALMLRVNLPVAIGATLIINPATIGPFYYAAYRVGLALMQLPPSALAFEISIEWLTTELTRVWKPLLLGCLILGSATAAVGYVALQVLWRLNIAGYLRQRRQRTPDSDA
jgi:uncharacterized protein (DUF2062 family)